MKKLLTTAAVASALLLSPLAFAQEYYLVMPLNGGFGPSTPTAATNNYITPNFTYVENTSEGITRRPGAKTEKDYVITATPGSSVTFTPIDLLSFESKQPDFVVSEFDPAVFHELDEDAKPEQNVMISFQRNFADAVINDDGTVTIPNFQAGAYAGIALDIAMRTKDGWNWHGDVLLTLKES